MATIRTPNDLVALLKARRIGMGESQAQFGARIRKSQAWVSDFERHATPNIYLGTLLEVLSLAGFDLEASPKGATHDDRRIVDADDDLAMDFPDESGGFVP